MRRAHWLKGNKGTPLPHAAVWLDTETSERFAQDGSSTHHLRFGWACYQRTRQRGVWTAEEWFRFTTPEELWAWIGTKARPRVRLYVYAHNWAFDGPVLDVFGQLPAAGWKLTRAIIESPPVIVAWRRDRSTVELLDTLNFWPVPLRQLGEHVGLGKLPSPGSSSSPGEWDTYCRRDVEVIRRATHEWWAFLTDHNLGGYAKTLAAQAMRAFRHRFMAHKILIDDDTSALLLARQALFGGRTEAYRLGRVRGPIDCWDINSMYPDVMATGLFPTVLRLHARAPTRAEWERWIPRWSAVAYVKLDTDSPQYPYRLNGRTVFPVGRFRTHLTTPELRAALQLGHLVDVEEIALYDSAPLFAGFVEELHGLRREAYARGENTRAWQLKVLLNALYGKFAQRGNVWKESGPAPPGEVRTWREVDADSGEVRDFCTFGGVTQERGWEMESHDSHPAIAAHVTAYARQKLWSLIRLAGPGATLYVDTDSLWTWPEAAGPLSEVAHPTALGCLKHVERVEWLLLHGPKDYVTPAGIVCKGVRSSAEWVSPHVIVQSQWMGLRGMVELGKLSNPRTAQVTKRMLRRYEKGTVARDGAVSPLLLAEW
jgi:hypothetical protein